MVAFFGRRYRHRRVKRVSKAEVARRRGVPLPERETRVSGLISIERPHCRHPYPAHVNYTCKCHAQMQNDWYFLPADRCLYEPWHIALAHRIRGRLLKLRARLTRAREALR